MSKLLELEKKNQEYQFNYNCLSPLEKKEFLLWIGSYHGKDMKNPEHYKEFHNKFYNKIIQYYNLIQDSTIDKKHLLEQLFDIPSTSIPDRFKSLTYQNSGLIDFQEYYLRQDFYNKEFDKYWNWLSLEIFNLTTYNISNIDNTIFRYSFLNCNKLKLNNDRTLTNYYNAIKNEERLYSKIHNVSTNELNHVIFIHFLAQTLSDCNLSKFDHLLKQTTNNIIVNIYHLLDPSTTKNIKKVS